MFERFAPGFRFGTERMQQGRAALLAQPEHLARVGQKPVREVRIVFLRPQNQHPLRN